MVNMPNEEEIERASWSVAHVYHSYDGVPLATTRVCLHMCFGVWSAPRMLWVQRILETYKALNNSNPMVRDVLRREFLWGSRGEGWGRHQAHQGGTE